MTSSWTHPLEHQHIIISFKIALNDSICLGLLIGCQSEAMLYNSLWHIDAIWRPRSGSTLAQVMVCCLTAPSHYLNQCWIIISKILLHSSDGNFTRDTSVINDLNQHENYSYKMSLKSPRPQWNNYRSLVRNRISNASTCYAGYEN